MNYALIYKLEHAMRFVYSHFLEEGETLQDFMSSRKELRPRIRHAVRSSLKKRMAPTLKQIAKAESRITQHAPDHSTIIHSIRASDHIKEQGIDIINELLWEFEQYWMGLNEKPVTERMKYYYDLPHHVLVLILVFCEEYGGGRPDFNDKISHEFGDLSLDFFKSEILK